MKIVVITSSPHPHDESTSIYLADRFTKGAEQAGHEVFTFDAANSDTHPCRSCDQCHMDGPCIWKDDIENTLMPKMLEADLLVLTTPLYYYGMSAQLKTIVDRFYSRTGRLHGKKSILMATAYNSADWTMSALVDHYDTLVRYMEWQDVGKVLGIGCGARSLVEHSKFGDMAEQMGANL
ncbi:flavodoxin family protein [Mitsuokella multacida]